MIIKIFDFFSVLGCSGTAEGPLGCPKPNPNKIDSSDFMSIMGYMKTMTEAATIRKAK